MPPTGSYTDNFIIINRCQFSSTSETSPYFFPGARSVKTGTLDYFYEFIDGGWVEFDGITTLVSRYIYDDEIFILVTFGAPYKYGPSPLTDEHGNTLRRMHYTYLDHILIYETMLEALLLINES